MKRLKKLLAVIAAVCLAFSSLLFAPSISAEAANTLDIYSGTFTINSLENDFKDGYYRINYKFSCNASNNNVYLKNIRLENSSGKTVATWKDVKFEGTGSWDKHFRIDFSSYPSGTYYFRYKVTTLYGSTEKSYYRTITHESGSVSYSSSKYVTDTNGNKKLQVTFNTKGLSGYSPKLEIYDSKGKLVKKYTTKKTLGSNNYNFYFTWDLTNSNGLPVSAGSYTFKFSANGKSGCKSLNIK